MSQYTSYRPVVSTDKFISIGGHIVRLSAIQGIQCNTSNTFILLKDNPPLQLNYHLTRAQAMAALKAAMQEGE